MSGYCSDCGNTMCVCNMGEEEMQTMFGGKMTYTKVQFELKPCPFCGSPGDLYYANEDGGFRAACSNVDCDCKTPPRLTFDEDTSVFEKIKTVIDSWNERITDQETELNRRLLREAHVMIAMVLDGQKLNYNPAQKWIEEVKPLI